MAYKIKVDNRNVYDLKDGFSVKEEFNETLDSGTVQFNVYGQEIDGVPFDDAEIYDTDNKISKKTLLVDSYDDEILSFGNNFSEDNHTYTMSLFSETKGLERITLPNCSVTQPLDGEKRYVNDEIDRFCGLFLPRIKVYDENEALGYRYEPVYQIDNRVYTKFNQVVCPEFQWNEPTLREVLNDLFSVKDCIVVVKNRTITYYDLAEKGNPIDVSLLSYSKKTISSADYCGELTINMQNAIGKNVTTVCEKKGLRTTEGELTTSNAMFITQQPIYNIKSCKISYFLIGSVSTYQGMGYFKEVDITDYIVEKDVYDVASSARYNPDSGFNAETAKGYKHYLLYYKRGSNQIQGWGESMKASSDSVEGGISHIGWIIKAVDALSFTTVINGDEEVTFRGRSLGFAWKKMAATSPNDIRGIHVDLVYETLSGHAMHVGKYLPVRHPDNRIFDNQSNSYVDANHQSIFEYAKVNRLGNKIRTIQGEYHRESDIPQLGDYIGDEILFSKEVIYYDDILYFKGMLTPNYILKDYFTGVRAKKRSWQLAKEEEALGRSDVIKFYIEFSFKQKTDTIPEFGLGVNSSFNPLLFVDSVQSHGAGLTADYCAIKTLCENTEYNPQVYEPYIEYPNQPYSYQIDLDREVQGMSLCFNFRTMDNVQVDYYCTEQDSSLVNNLYKYCNKYGECISIYIAIASYINYTDGETLPSNHQIWSRAASSDSPIGEAAGNSAMSHVMEVVSRKPKIRTDSTGKFNDANQITVKFALQKGIYKDNREIIQNHIQFEYCSDNKNIIVTQRLIELCSLNNPNNHPRSSVKVWISTSASDVYGLNDTKAKGTQLSAQSVYNQHITITGNMGKFSIRINLIGQLQTLTSWCISDSDNNILMAVNGNTKQVYVNLLKSRDTNIYYSQQDRTIVGNITNDSLAQLDSNVAAYEATLNEGE